MHVPSRFTALTNPKGKRARNAAIIRFLDELWSYGKEEYTFLYTRLAGTDRMVPHAIRGDRAAKIAALLEERSPKKQDYYFCPNAFDAPRNAKNRALGTRYAWADIDDADPNGFKPKPNVLWETSEGRFQGLWIWQREAPAHEAERYSRNLWRNYGGDRGAWSANKLLRVPGTINHKPERKGEAVRLLRFDPHPKRIPNIIRDLDNVESRVADREGSKLSVRDPVEVMHRYRPAMGIFAGSLMMAQRVMRRDRSGAVFAFVSKMMEVGAPDDEIAAVVLVNPYFLSKWGRNVPEAQRQIHRIRDFRESGR